VRFGFAQIPSEDVVEHVALVKLGEELGFDDAWITDQTFYRDPYVILSMAAQETEHITLGIGVTNPYTRHPAMTARAMATLHESAPGRLNLGVGAGNRQELLARLGIDATHDAARCLETVEIVRRLLTGEKTTFKGDYYSVDDVTLQTAAASDVRLYVGGRGPRILQTAGRVADGVIIGGLSTASGMNYVWEQVGAGLRDAGRDATDLEIVCWITCFLLKDPAAKREAIRPWIAHFIGEAPRGVLKAVELPAETVRAIREAYKKGGSAGAAQYVTEDCIDAFSLITDPDRGIERIEALSQAGVTQFCMLLPIGSLHEHRKHLENFAQDVFPRFKSDG
jgi:5,10-methylenetetrahydromethanopterin reductase